MWTIRATFDEQTRLFRLPPGEGRTLGRGTHADFIVGDPLISRIHCRFTASEQQLHVEDLKSTNGTFVNDTRVDVAFLGDGDRIRVGKVDLIVGRGGAGASKEND
jgi:pSer/pThr/pTyr-binding forkhead associated (FHA) protein